MTRTNTYEMPILQNFEKLENETVVIQKTIQWKV